MRRRIPSFVLRANRNRADAEANASYYAPAKKLTYLVDAGDGRGAVKIDLFTWTSTTMLQVLTARDRRMISELLPGEAMDLHGVTLHCVTEETNA